MIVDEIVASDSPTALPRDEDTKYWESSVQSRIEPVANIVPTSPLGDVVRARDTLRSNLQAMHLAMGTLGERYNALVPISRLPAEMLSRIFQECSSNTPTPPQDMYREYRPHPHQPLYGPGHRDRDLGWISITHVCRRWRATALAAHALWGTITFRHGPRWAQEMIARSHSVPLVFDSAIPDGRHTRDIDVHLLISHLPRIKVLHFTGNYESVALLMHALSQPLPALESLSINSVEPSLQPAQLQVPIEFLGGQAMRLRNLEIYSLMRFIPWASAAFRTLVSLSVNHRTANAPPIDTFLGCMAGMINLESLRLLECPWDGGATHRVVHLPRLAAVHFSALLPDCVLFLEHIRVPASSSLVLRPSVVGPATANIPVTVLIDYLQGGSTMHRRRLSGLTYTENDDSYSLFAQPEYSDALEDSGTPMRRIWGDVPLPAGAVLLHFPRPMHELGVPLTADLVHLVRSVFDVSRVDRLVVSSDSFRTASLLQWAELVAAVRGVHDVGAVLHASPLFGALMPSSIGPAAAGHGQAGTPAEILLPDLRAVYVASMEFNGEGEAPGGGSEDSLAMLLAFLHARAAAGCPIKTLTIYECEISQQTVYMLRQIVETVNWDECRKSQQAVDMLRQIITRQFML